MAKRKKDKKKKRKQNLKNSSATEAITTAYQYIFTDRKRTYILSHIVRKCVMKQKKTFP
jgi:hypothetical protein